MPGQRQLTSDAEDLQLLSAGAAALHAADEPLSSGVEARSFVDVVLEIREAVLGVAVVSLLDSAAIARDSDVEVSPLHACLAENESLHIR